MLRITDNYTLQTLCGAPHNVCNEEGKITGMAPNRAVYEENPERFMRVNNEIVAVPFKPVRADKER